MKWKRLDEHVVVRTHCNIHTCEKYGANLCCPRFQPETVFAFCTVNQKNLPGPGPCEAAPQESGFSACPTTMCHRSVPESTACKHDEACLRWYREGEIIPATHFPEETSCRILVRTRGFVTTYLGPNFVSSTQPRKPK